jgi:SAM-dependent methyltransferase
LLADLPRGRALDIGCGSGQLLDELQQRGWVANGIEPFAAPEPDPRIVVTTLDDYARSKSVSASFDLVTLVHAFEHLPEPRAALTQIKGLVRPGGHIAIVVPNFGGHWARAAGLEWPWLNPHEHWFHYTERSLRQLIRTVGLDVVRRYTRSRNSGATVLAWLGRVRAYERFPLRHQPLRGVAFHMARLSERPVGWMSDRLSAGAELVMLCRRPESPARP